MIRRLVLVLGFLALGSAAALAADANGRWQGTIDTPDGPLPVVYQFAVSGEDVTGTATGPQGEIPIENGKIDGDLLTFTLTMGDGTLVMHEGTVSEEDLVMTIRGPWGEFTFNLQRAAADQP